MRISTKCWYGKHVNCNYMGCICECHKWTRMHSLLEELKELDHKQRQKHPEDNPHPLKINNL